MNKTTVLIVDDEEDFLAIINERIKSWGYETICVTNGQDALEMVKGEKAEIIVLDYKMPKMDGVTAFKKIREVDAEIPVIMFTAYPDKKSFRTADKLNISAYVPKLSLFSDTQNILRSALEVAQRKLMKRRGEV